MWPVIVPGILQVLFASFVAREINVDHWGKFVLVQITANLIAMLFTQMASESAARFHNTDYHKDILSDFFLLHVLYLIIAISLLSYPVSLIVNVEFNHLLIMIMATISFSFVGILGQHILLNGERNSYGVAKILESFAKYIIPAAAYFFHRAIEILIVSYVVSSLFCNVYLLKLINFKLVFTFNWLRIKKYFSFSYHIIFIIPLAWVVTSSDRIIIERNLSLNEVGAYSILASFAALIQAIGQIYSYIVTPKALKLYSIDPISSFEYIANNLRKLIILLIFLNLLAFIIPDIVYFVFFGANVRIILENKIVFHFLLFGSSCAVVQSALGLYLSLIKRLEINTAAYFYAAVFNFIFNIFLVEYGIIYAAISTAASYLLIVVFIARSVDKYKCSIFEHDSKS